MTKINAREKDTSFTGWLEWLSQPAPGAVFIALGVAASFVIGLPTHRYALPVLNALFLYPALIINARRKRVWRNVFLIAFWGFMLNATVIVMTQLDPELMAANIVHGDAYTEEMFRWIRTGEGVEGDWRLFIPIHVKCYAALLALTTFTGGFGGLAFAAVLVNFMAYYVGRLVFDAPRPLPILLIGWPVWSIIRACGFLAAVVAIMEACYDRIARQPINWRRLMRLLQLSVLFIVLDIIIKATCAEFWRGLLSTALGGGP